MEWYVYIVECCDGTYYTGATNNVERRVNAHNYGSRGAKYTRKRRPVKLVCYVGGMTKSEALSLEYKVKQLRRCEKVPFIKKLANNLKNSPEGV